MQIKHSLFSFFIAISIYSCSSTNDNSVSQPNETSQLKKDVNTKATQLFQTNCASCHNPMKDGIGPALHGTLSRVPSRKWLVKWIRNSNELISSNDAYAVAIYEKWNKSPMTAFTNLSDEDINLLIDEYCQ